MKILVTGGTGFLGQKLVRRLKSMGYEVTTIGRNIEVGVTLEKEGIHFIPFSLDDKKETIKVCKDMDYVFHCAALSSPWGKYMDFYNSNVIATKNIIEGCKSNNVNRLIHVSTPSIYFDFTDRFNISENDPLPKKTVNMYAETKLLAEKELDIAFKEGLPVISIRPRALFGPNDTTIIPRLIKANQVSGVPIIGSGKQVIDITYVENVVDALLLCMNSPSSTLGQKYNITNGEPIELISLLEKVFTKLDIPFNKRKLPLGLVNCMANSMEFACKHILTNKEPVLTKYSVGVLSKSQTLNITKAKTELGYTPKVSVEEGIDLFVEWWKEQNKE